MNKIGGEVNSVVYSNTLNVDYLPREDAYIFRKKTPKYKFNIIGCGMIAHEHIKVTILEGNATIYGIYDTNPLSIKNIKNMVKENYPDLELVVYENIEDACNDENVDGLIISTPNYSHIDEIRVAIKSEKHILLEKPMVTNVKDAIELREIAENYGNVFQIGLQYRFKAIYEEARHEVLERKSLGDIHTISIVEHRIPFLDKIDQWNKFSEYSGGTLVEKCCHYFDLFNLFAGAKPEYVFAVGGRAVNFKNYEYKGKKSDILDHAHVIVTYENGVKCNFNLCMFAPMFYEEITICGEKGRITAYENEDYLPTDKPHTHFEMHTSDHLPSRMSTPCYPKNIQESGHMGGTYFEHKKFIDTIDGKKTDVASIDEGFWSVMVGIAAEESVKTGKKVYIKDLLERGE